MSAHAEAVQAGLLGIDALPLPSRTIPTPGYEDLGALPRTPEPYGLVAQMPLWSDEPIRLVGHTLEVITSEDGAVLTICHTHRRERRGWANPCR